MAKAPDRGSFPLDHFHECDQQAKAYSNCVSKHQLMPKRCRTHQMKYLQCRMKSGLMEHEQMNKLGFVQENSWETEQAQKKFLFDSIQNLKKKAWQRALLKERVQLQKEKQQKTPTQRMPQ